MNLPNITLRVSEHIEEIVEFIEKIKSNGFAYESNGSTYFDSEAFRKKGSQKLFHENIEGQETQIYQVEEKRNPRDFALWKKTDQNGFGWQTKFGYGRPGWHIECSAMIW